MAEATAPQPGDQQPIRWVHFSSRAAMVRAIRDFDVYGGFVVPADFSENIVALGTARGVAPPARIDVLASSETGQFGTAVFERVTNLRTGGRGQRAEADRPTPPSGRC